MDATKIPPPKKKQTKLKRCNFRLPLPVSIGWCPSRCHRPPSWVTCPRGRPSAPTPRTAPAHRRTVLKRKGNDAGRTAHAWPDRHSGPVTGRKSSTDPEISGSVCGSSTMSETNKRQNLVKYCPTKCLRKTTFTSFGSNFGAIFSLRRIRDNTAAAGNP